MNVNCFDLENEFDESTRYILL